jgi:hypothetical protein
VHLPRTIVSPVPQATIPLGVVAPLLSFRRPPHIAAARHIRITMFARRLKQKAKPRRMIVHRVQKFVEVGSGRIGYALTANALAKVSNGTQWRLDPSFSVGDTVLATPEFASVLRAVLKDGHVLMPPMKAQE